MAHYLFNYVEGYAANGSAPREPAAEFLRVGMWGVGADESHRDELAPGDHVLIYLGAPERMFVGRAELGSAVHEWTPTEAQLYPGNSAAGVRVLNVRHEAGRQAPGRHHGLSVAIVEDVELLLTLGAPVSVRTTAMRHCPSSVRGLARNVRGLPAAVPGA